MVAKLLIFLAILGVIIHNVLSCGNVQPGETNFPSNFTFGVSTASYQIEGGWNADGKGLSIWDTFTHNSPGMIDDRSNGDVAADSYNRFDQDLVALKEMGVDHYRFSISWPRILPTGDISSLNQPGIDYYNMVIDKLIENGIQPMVTMYHYDMPEELQKLGGLTNPLFIKYFLEYANLLYKSFGDRVPTWVTFNEPNDYCTPGYGNANYPPQIHLPGIADYLCMDHTLKAHAKAYRLYREKYYDDFRGKVGISINSRYMFSKTNDSVAIDRGMQYMLGWLIHPIFSKSGGYPEVMVNDIGNNSLNEKRAWSRLPVMDDEWKNTILGAGDFIGLNYYTSRYISEAKTPQGENPSWDRDARQELENDPNWKMAKSSWLFCVPEGLEGLLKYIRNEYNNAEVIITEIGWSDNGELEDDDRMGYLKSHLQAVINAINDGCNVTGFTVWSFIDNFEWQRGYTEKFGLYYVDYNSTNLERIPKKSSKFFKKVIADRSIPNDFV